MATSAEERRMGGMTAAAFQAARELGHHWVGSEHLLLGVIRIPSAAQDVLRAAGVTEESLQAALRTAVGSSGTVTDGTDGPPGGGLTTNPRFHEVRGFATALAATMGAEQAGPEHVLLAVAWQPDCLAAQLLRTLGVDLRRVPTALAERGVALPHRLLAVPPRWDEVAWGPSIQVPGPQAAEIAGRLARRLPAGTPLAFNHDAKGHGWVMTAESVDLTTQVEAVLAELHAE